MRKSSTSFMLWKDGKIKVIFSDITNQAQIIDEVNGKTVFVGQLPFGEVIRVLREACEEPKFPHPDKTLPGYPKREDPDENERIFVERCKDKLIVGS